MYYNRNFKKGPEGIKSLTTPTYNVMMVRPMDDNFVKHLIALNFTNSYLFNMFSVNTTEDKLEGAVKKLRMTVCREKPGA